VKSLIAVLVALSTFSMAADGDNPVIVRTAEVNPAVERNLPCPGCLADGYTERIAGCGTRPLDAGGRSGCCSWHQGVCGCSGERTLCCDGTLSPSCRCD
jgi:hypothetical protein